MDELNNRTASPRGRSKDPQDGIGDIFKMLMQRVIDLSQHLTIEVGDDAWALEDTELRGRMHFLRGRMQHSLIHANQTSAAQGFWNRPVSHVRSAFLEFGRKPKRLPKAEDATRRICPKTQRLPDGWQLINCSAWSDLIKLVFRGPRREGDLSQVGVLIRFISTERDQPRFVFGLLSARENAYGIPKGSSRHEGETLVFERWFRYPETLRDLSSCDVEIRLLELNDEQA